MTTKEEIKQILNETSSKWEGDNAFQGLQIISKYTSNLRIRAGQDVIYSISVDGMITLGITKEDLEKLALLNWMIYEDCLACFV